ncbi:NAD(P)H-dependent oxidoreductase [Sulfitobacter pseudonitzschiae]|uniref:NAD(P)H-dependent oxidoreductase n=1 Tax=Pseudosulfitobacter pseudonitzschiae TaxID=1402135 RepID=UPI001D7F976F|nr:NAD(P)H-dependent oxidoreductase [Pseudosulfitobacter pseudonitzschiae]MBM1817337.1 NAD(P)H-dependent oxidoreductase [Pseudosulfitobacter pseudonitzschiae]MBM1868300.1 NAD(P)H-dependent oxidoreductase [Pseudosulfitobacter pseudonitzschiae]MBM1892541.1 NAD(P)H-dependent oxidoreductase [Pseudosulfitobacter pseudonitzschiae]MBM1911857.1 NAD(P)H-dependent oxidoreductase [Pseudosulfitobacter pseudonitzschiae]MBM1916778.1 NAD(P)H-dependent oxidoreductase [Pseudosulfitobacter pseudonitzschiae]
MAPKITVLFYSTYGTNHGVAQEAARAAEAAGAEVRLRRCKETAPAEVINGQEAWRDQLEKMQDIPEATPDDMEWADGYFVSVPTRFGVSASQFRAFVDTLGPLWQSGALANKVITATTSAQNTNGGQEATIQSVYVTAMHWGAIIVPPGYADPIKFEDGGNPYGYSCTPGALDETGKKSVAFQAKRLVEYASKLVN